MTRTITLAEIERRTGVSVDRLRYIIDTRILPGRREGTLQGTVTRGRGVARQFLEYEAFGIVIAVIMLDAGVKRDTLKQCLDILTDYPKGTRDIRSVMLFQAFQRNEVAALELGDGQNVRLVYDSVLPTGRTGDWIQVGT